jgi:hypothetical protein
VYEALEVAIEALSAQPSPGGQDASFPWENFPAYLIDKCEGDTISEEGLQQALAAMAKDERYCLAARQPVGESVWVEVRREGDRTFPRAMTRDQADAFLRSCNVGPLPTIHPLYATPPAQGVDLGPVRALLQRRIEQWRSHLPADPGAPGTREIETKGEHDYNNDVRIYREGIAVMDEVLALIDSQAVGK